MKHNLSEICISYRPSYTNRLKVGSPQEVFPVLKRLFNEDTIELREEAVCLYLNRAQEILGWYKISTGGINGTIVDIRLLLGIALKGAASGLILAHNHPSGNLHPSSNDKELTKKLKDSASLMGLQLIDHIILTSNSYFSFSENTLL